MKFIIRKLKWFIWTSIRPFLIPFIDTKISELKLMEGQTLLRLQSPDFNCLANNEFKVFSQYGDDGIIQFLINELSIENKYFVEFGVENYRESNTRFLLLNNNWSGLVIDGSEKNIAQIKKEEIYWRHDLLAVNAFVNRENINEIIGSRVKGNIGLLHIDIDGNDYWIWERIDVIDSDIVIVEYNSVFGQDRAITIPYRPDFQRSKAHYSNLFFGASLPAFAFLAEKKGYYLIGSNSAGNNAYFLKNKFKSQISPVAISDAFVDSKFRESRNVEGDLTFLRDKERLEIIKGNEVYNIVEDCLEKL